MTALPNVDNDIDQALAAAAHLVAHGVPLFLARPALERGEWNPTGGTQRCGYWLPRQWQRVEPDPAVIDRWRTGDAIAAVMGHAVDLLDIDPRNGGDATKARLLAAGLWPRSYGTAATPSGGTHDFIRALGERSLDGLAAGLDVKGGDADGEGRGFAWIAPTIKLSKTTGEITAYRWLNTPRLDEIDAVDDSGEEISYMIRQARTPGLNDGSGGGSGSSYTDPDIAVLVEHGVPVGVIRHDTLRDVVWKMRSKGASRAETHAIWAAVVAATEANRPEPWPTRASFAALWDGADRKISRSEPTVLDAEAARATGSTDGEPPHRGQLRIAYRLADTHADRLMFVYGIGWHYFDGRRWAEDDRGEAKRAVVKVLQTALAEAVKLASDDRDKLIADVRKCETSNGLGGVLDLASALLPFAHTVADLDADPYLLNTANGTLDLRTFQSRRHDPADRCTKVTRAAYEPSACSQMWQTFIDTVLPDEGVRGYLQRLAGLSLLGKVTEHVFTVSTGTGANGKSTCFSALLNALGDYGHAAESDLFMQAKANPNGASPALMGLRGKRLVVVSETERDQRLAVALMKNLTGGDVITARPLYGKPVTFPPSHTSVMVTNFLPKVAGDDPAVWRRIRVIPFDVVIPAEDRDGLLGERLELAADTILTWAVDGYRQYAATGLSEPEAVLNATGDYRHASDAIARFVAETCYLSPHACALTGELFTRWTQWAVEEGVEPLSAKKFGQALDGHGYTAAPGGRAGRQRRGIGLLAEEEGEDQA